MRCGGLAKGKSTANAAARLLPKDPEQQPMVRSSLRDGPGDPSCLLCVGQRLDGAAVHFIVLPQREAWQ